MGSLFGRPGPDKFAGMVIDEIRDGGEHREIRYDSDRFRLVIGPDSDEHVLHLGNVYGEYLRSPRRERRRLLVNFAQIQREAARFTFPESFQEAKDHLFPRLQHRLYFETTRLLQGLVIPYRPLSEDLAHTVVFDTPQSILSLCQQQLDDWGVSLEEALLVARDNLWAVSNQEFLRSGEGVYTSPWEDNYDASRLVLQPLIRQLKLEGEHVVLPTHRDELLVAGSENLPALRALAKAAREAFAHPRFISAVPLRLAGDDWVTFCPEDPDLAEEFRALRLMSRTRDYQEQKELLEELHQKGGEEVFVASSKLASDERSGVLEDYAAWSRGVDTLLPRCGRVALYDSETEKVLGMFEWDHLVSVVGDLMESTDYHPARFRVRRFPTEEQLASLKAASLSG